MILALVTLLVIVAFTALLGVAVCTVAADGDKALEQQAQPEPEEFWEARGTDIYRISRDGVTRVATTSAPHVAEHFVRAYNGAGQ